MTLTKLLLASIAAVVLLGVAIATASPQSARSGVQACPTPTLYPTPAASLEQQARQVAAQEYGIAQSSQRRLRGECP